MQALQNRDITVFGDGLTGFCYVDDLIEGFSRFMKLNLNGEAPTQSLRQSK